MCVCVKQMVTTNQKYARDIQEIEKGIQTKHYRKATNIQEKTSGEKKKEQRTTKTIRKQLMAITTYLSIITLNISG